MPQMSPLMWLLLYCFFLVVLVLANVILNYLFLIEKKNEDVKGFKKLNFKWTW